jgi:hypothetical protein
MNINGIDITIGSDPELFVKREGRFISGHDLVPGTKANPHPVRGGAVQVDGTALEFNTKPAATVQAFHKSTNMVLEALSQMLPDKHELVAVPTVHYKESYLDSLPPEARALGCSPDYNAYTGAENPRPDGAASFRTGAGHIHIGWTEDADITDPQHILDCRALVQALDIFLGVPSVFLDPDIKRRELYGKAGAFRPKPYGVEYRVLSNFWVMEPTLRTFVFNNTLEAIRRLTDKSKVMPKPETSQVDVINFSAKGKALNLLSQFSVPMPKDFSAKEERKKIRTLW